jgi:hypothetical protein
VNVDAPELLIPSRRGLGAILGRAFPLNGRLPHHFREYLRRLPGRPMEADLE